MAQIKVEHDLLWKILVLFFGAAKWVPRRLLLGVDERDPRKYFIASAMRPAFVRSRSINCVDKFRFGGRSTSELRGDSVCALVARECVNLQSFIVACCQIFGEFSRIKFRNDDSHTRFYADVTAAYDDPSISHPSAEMTHHSSMARWD